MIYLDASVALAHLLAEDRRPSSDLWAHPIVSSRLLSYEVWVRLNGRGLARSHGEAARRLLAQVSQVELTDDVLDRARAPFPVRVRTLDALHLSTFEFLRREGQATALATFDRGMIAAARAMRIPLAAV